MSNPQNPWGNYQLGPNPNPNPNPYPYASPQFPNHLQPRRPPPEQFDEGAKKALGFGIASILLCCCPLAGAVLGVVAVIHGWNAMQLDHSGSKTLGMIGLICGVVGVVCSGLLLIVSLLLNVFDPNF